MLESRDYDKVDLLHNAYLKSLLNHAVNTTQFYKKYSGFSSLEDFPIINKNIIRNDIEVFFSDKFNRKKLKKVTTGGSTGAPFTVYQDSSKRKRHQAENIYLSEKIGYSLGSRLYYMRVWNQINRKSLPERFLQNIIMQDASDLSDDSINDFLRKLERDKSKKSILAFASTLEALANYISRKNFISKGNISLNCIISISETLPDGARSILRNTFHCPVISRYSNIENGFIAQQCLSETGEYHINKASFHVEILDINSNKHADEGQIGRAVVTDLFNYSMPLIRYDTGDLAVFSGKSVCDSPGPVFTKIEGRRVDFIYDTSNNLLSPHVITNTMWKYAGTVRQFQFIQESQFNYVMNLNCFDNKFSETDELKEDLKSFIGKDAVIDFNLVDEIPVLASGKRKKIINYYKTL
jgi:phenylacetate-CoA ligase